MCISVLKTCISIKTDQYVRIFYFISGTITFPQAGTIKELRLRHVSGFVACKSNGFTGFWGGCRNQAPLNVWITEDKDFSGTSRPNKIKEDILFPLSSVRASATKRGFYSMNPLADDSEDITFVVGPPDTVTVVSGDYRIWYGEDLFNRRVNNGNDGTHCVEVFATYN